MEWRARECAHSVTEFARPVTGALACGDWILGMSWRWCEANTTSCIVWLRAAPLTHVASCLLSVAMPGAEGPYYWLMRRSSWLQGMTGMVFVASPRWGAVY
jgi:hypothetical protein